MKYADKHNETPRQEHDRSNFVQMKLIISTHKYAYLATEWVLPIISVFLLFRDIQLMA